MCFRGGWGSGGVTQWIWRRILNRPLEVFSGNLRGALRLFLYGRAGDKASQVWLFLYLLMRNEFWVQFPSKWRLFAGLSLCLTWSSPANLVLLDDTSGGILWLMWSKPQILLATWWKGGHFRNAFWDFMRCWERSTADCRAVCLQILTLRKFLVHNGKFCFYSVNMKSASL